MTELNDLYSDRIIELAAAIPPARTLDNPDTTASAHSKLCGSTIAVELKLEDDRITDYGQTVKACLLGQASASVVANLIVGTSAAEIRDIARQMRAMLKDNGPPPGGRWADLAVLEPVREVKGRHASTLLVFEAVLRALDAYEAKDAGATASGTAQSATA
ncbi:MAG: iron-sulfur cluster assembly scaffold protein [Hyphomicrobiaceae bacterium]